MDVLSELGEWIQTFLVTGLEWLPFIDNGEVFIENISKWLTGGAVGGGLASIPLYQILLARRTARYAKRVIKRVIKWVLIIGGIALALQFL